ncbi:unnamed protein product [Pocillopora meandrina]|uniref:Uncharacterized protein n=1 Tax=Pocillopora meandrina TaxID=46732 RepID=A0AAU9W7V6_9CNID|nr:unnamed protein product [Pocillopora meandrina]
MTSLLLSSLTHNHSPPDTCMLQCGGILGAAENTVTQILEVHYNEQVTANKGNSSGIWKTIRRALPKKSSKLS